MTLRYTEDTARQRIVEMINKIIREENLPFDRADVQIEIKENGKEVRYPDIVLWKRRRAEGALLIELKQPIYDPWNVADEAHNKAWKANIRFFATWNLRKFFWWDRYREGDRFSQLCGCVDVADIKDLSELDRAEPQIRRFLKEFLKEFSEIYAERKPVPLIPLDERFIARLRSAVDAFSIPVLEEVRKRYKVEPEFRKKLIRWFAEQGYLFQGTDDDFERVARQYVYLLVDKIIFYNTLRLRYKWLPEISIASVTKGEEFRRALQTFFNAGLKIDFETIFAADFLDTIPPPDDLVEPIGRFIDEIGRYDLSKIGYEVIGRVFERLIPDLERHKLGQYYTRSDVVDLIVGFCVRKADDKVFDPACGAGTFLVRAYERKKFLDPSRDHETLLKELWGNDIAKFPSHLTTINLACKDLSVERNHPIVFSKDFFSIPPGGTITLLPYEVEGLDKTRSQVRIPQFDAVVMNPPYTKHQEMEDLVFPEGYRTWLQKLVKEEWNGFHVGKRSSIYVYFFIHGAKFLRRGGRLGLITSNSWLDVDYGKYLQEFFLKNFKIIAIIESKVERWFEDADINTCITILEKCDRGEERDDNLVKFVQLKRPLTEFVPITEKEEERWGAIDEFVRFIGETDEYYEDDRVRIYPKKQIELWEEGFNEETGRYEGAKWGKYIRAPDIFFKILERGRELFVPLKEVAEIRRGFTTGANEFFYLTEEEIQRWGIEREFWMHPLKRDEEIPVSEHVWRDEGGEYFKKSQYSKDYPLDEVLREDGFVYWIPNYVIKYPKECKSIIIDPKDLKYRVLMIHKDKEELKGTNVLKYIEWGEAQGFHERPTCASRKRWYDLGERVPTRILFLRATEDRPAIYVCKNGVVHDQTFYSIYPKDTTQTKIIASLLNSTVVNFLFREIYSGAGKALGLGALWSAVYEAGNLPIFNPSKLTESQIQKLEKSFDKLSKREVLSIFEEIGADSLEEVSLGKVKPDRRELDEIIMGEILGLGEEEQLEVYRAVIDLVKSRSERARSVDKRRKRVKGIDVDALVESVSKEIGELKRFPDDYIGTCVCEELTVPRGRVEIGSDLFGFYVRVGEWEHRCESSLEAKYILYAAMNGHTRIRIPVDKNVLREAVERYESVLKETKRMVSDLLEATVPDRKLREKIEGVVWERLWRRSGGRDAGPGGTGG